MQPTNRLRFVKRVEIIEHDLQAMIAVVKPPVRILQQFWAEYDAFNAQITGEWRDVPLEVET